MQRRISAFLDPGTGAWGPEETHAMSRIREAAMSDDYALAQLRHLTNDIGPRLSGSAQAAQAVEYVAAEMRALGASVTLEKTMVPHWVRGMESGALVQWNGMAPSTLQKIVLTSLGGSVATPASGITAPLVVLPDFEAYEQLPEGALKGKIVLFNHPFDKQLAAEGMGGQAYGQSVVYRGAAPSLAAAAGAVAALAGNAVSMQVIHLMQKLGIRPQRTLRFIAWMDEESGSEGAQTYAAEHAAELKDHVGALESDLGCDHPTGILFAGTPQLSEWLAPVGRALAPIGAARGTWAKTRR